ncbi:MAG: hypothetical protein RLZZ399_1877 [Verrucomicrobiota bacterium]|jgi:tRNA (mo5U34)-methyltransferase
MSPTPIPLDLISDSELHTLNELLPWACFTVDSRGRRVGRPFAEHKRNEPQVIPDFRIVELNQRFPLVGKSVLELGCFEGVHTIGLCQHGALVTAIDGRVEHVVKTQTRCALYGYHPEVYCLDLEGPEISKLPEFDILHHVGVLYHLTDPVGHLRSVLQRTREAVLLDTHVARSGEITHRYESYGASYPVRLYREGGRTDPFSGLREHAKWLLHEDISRILANEGFSNIQELAVEEQRNGLRVCLFAQR